MTHPDALFWNERYQHEERWRDRHPPRLLLTSHLDLLPQHGLALDVACGTSASGLYLAVRGWQVIGLDVSNAALRLAQSRVRQEALPVSFALMDLKDPWLPAERFDVILNFYYLSRPLLQTYRHAVKPGGLLFFETFLREETFFPFAGGNPDHYLRPHELRDAFSDWDIVHYTETHHGERPGRARRIAQLVARKPVRKENK